MLYKAVLLQQEIVLNLGSSLINLKYYVSLNLNHILTSMVLLMYLDVNRLRVVPKIRITMLLDTR